MVFNFKFLMLSLLTILNFLFRDRLEFNQETMQLVWHPIIDFEHLMKSEHSTVFGGSPKVFSRYRSGQMKCVEAEKGWLTGWQQLAKPPSQQFFYLIHLIVLISNVKIEFLRMCL